MSEVVRLSVVSHAMTDAMAAGRFPIDEPLNSLGHRQADASIELGPVDAAYCGPEKRTRQTAELLGLRAEVEPLLADLDCGLWRGGQLPGVQPAELAIWLTDPAQAPHGGETVVELIDRVRRWMDAVSARRGRLVAVTASCSVALFAICTGPLPRASERVATSMPAVIAVPPV